MTKSKVRESGRYHCCKEKCLLECSKSARVTALCSVHDLQCNFVDVGTRGGSLASSRGYLEIAGNGQPPIQTTTQDHHTHHTSPMCSKYTDQSLLSFCSVSIIILREYPRVSRPLRNPHIIQLPIKFPLSSPSLSLPLSHSDTTQYPRKSNKNNQSRKRKYLEKREEFFFNLQFYK